MEIIISESENFISIHIICDNEKSLSWENIQEIKDYYYSSLDFIEVYPRKEEIINKSNVRHIIHIKNWICPKLMDLETNSNIKFKNYANKFT